jgi:hypothetical protein
VPNSFVWESNIHKNVKPIFLNLLFCNLKKSFFHFLFKRRKSESSLEDFFGQRKTNCLNNKQVGEGGGGRGDGDCGNGINRKREMRNIEVGYGTERGEQ